MKEFQENIDKIEEYLEGNSDEATVLEIEKTLANDEKFRKDFETYKLLFDGIRYSGRKELHEKMKAWDRDFSDDINGLEISPQRNNFKWYAIAASVLFFVVVGVVISVNLDSGYQGVVAEYYEPHNLMPPTTRGEKSDQLALDLIYQHYDNAQYNQVISLIDQLDINQKSDLILFLLANSHQAVGNYDEAIELFSKFSESETGFKSSADWYRALCLLSKNEVDQAIPILEKLSVSNTYHESDAKSLLEELN